MALKIQRLSTGWNTQPGLFERIWDAAMTFIETAITDILAAQAAATAAQTSANTAQATATAAQAAAATAQSEVDLVEIDVAAAEANIATLTSDLAALTTTVAGKVAKDQTAFWGAPAGTLARSGVTAFVGFTPSAAYSSGEMQTVITGLEQTAQRLAALITDLRANDVLTS